MSPIRPEMKALYPPPAEWKAIREKILERARNRCERCGLENYALGRWERDGRWTPREAVLGGMHSPTRVVLTVAHVAPSCAASTPACVQPDALQLTCCTSRRSIAIMPASDPTQ